MKKVFNLLIFLIILFIPLHVKADTWLDDPSYRDTSWFDPATYNSTDSYTLRTPAEAAGFLYLVNVEEYTFSNKQILFRGNLTYQWDVGYATQKVIDMRAHEWIPLKDYFDGIFNGQFLNYGFLTKSINKKTRLVESPNCKINWNSNGGLNVEDDTGCTWLYVNEAYYTHEIETNGHGTIELPDIVLAGKDQTITITPDDGYYLADLTITKKSNDENVTIYRTDSNKYVYVVPYDEITIEATFNEIGNATCKYIKGNGTNIGDEISCGSEQFYVIKNENNSIKMMSKYNLNTGVKIFKVPVESGKSCHDIARENNATNKSDAFYTAEGYCFYYKYLPTIGITQNEEAKSAHWDEELNYLYPQVGDVYMVPNGGTSSSAYYEPINKRQIENTDFYDFDLNLEPEFTYSYNNSSSAQHGVRRSLYQYKYILSNMANINVQNISMLSVSELNDIIEEVSNERIPLKEWGDEVKATFAGTNNNMDVTFGSFKSYLPNNYKWLYSTTYWNSTIFSSDTTWSNEYFVFVAEQGKLCGAGFLNCAPTTTLGCGIRPVVTVPSDSIKYSINVAESTSGSIEVVDSANGNDMITFNAVPTFGYTLAGITIKTESGETIEITEDEIVKNNDGTISISRNSFTMPFENITITPKWVIGQTITNPKTGNIFFRVVLLAIFIVSEITLLNSSLFKKIGDNI